MNYLYKSKSLKSKMKQQNEKNYSPELPFHFRLLSLMWFIKWRGARRKFFKKQNPREIIRSCFVGVSLFFTPMRYSTNSRKAYKRTMTFFSSISCKYPWKLSQRTYRGSTRFDQMRLFYPLSGTKSKPVLLYRSFLQERAFSKKLDLP